MESQSHPREYHKLLPQGVHRGIEPLGSNSRNLLPEGSGELQESLGGRPLEDAEGLRRKAMLGGTTFLNVSYFEELRRNLKR